MICSPSIQIVASPSQPLLPDQALQTSTRPRVARQACAPVPPPAIVVSRTLDLLQSRKAVARYVSQSLDMLSPSRSVNGLLVRAQWYGPQACVAPASEGTAEIASKASRRRRRERARVVVRMVGLLSVEDGCAAAGTVSRTAQPTSSRSDQRSTSTAMVGECMKEEHRCPQEIHPSHTKREGEAELLPSLAYDILFAAWRLCVTPHAVISSMAQAPSSQPSDSFRAYSLAPQLVRRVRPGRHRYLAGCSPRTG
jgi:hypothetical protein